MANAQAHRRGDPHDWNSIENYVYLHLLHLDEHPLVEQGVSSLRFIPIHTPQAPYDILVVEGLIVCRNGLRLEISKSGDMERTTSRRVRMALYSYNAYRPGGHNVLRYDNQHRGTENVYHRHQFDVDTGELVSFTTMPREAFPVMHQILDELVQLVPLPPHVVDYE